MITQQAIQERSYTIWEREGRPLGRHFEHWVQAEAELRAAEEAPPAPKPVRGKRGGAPKTGMKRSKAAAEAAMPVVN